MGDGFAPPLHVMPLPGPGAGAAWWCLWWTRDEELLLPVARR